MKTEPTEAYRMIEEDWYAIPYMGMDYPQDPDIVVNKEDVYEIAKKAFQEGQSNLIVKQLKWAEGFFALLSDTPFGIYQILRPAGTHSAHIIYLNDKPILIVSDLNEAKSAAQADFEKRIKECLE